MIYGLYKNARDGAWRCLIDFKVSELPVSPLKIAHEAGVKVVKNSDVNELSAHESGISLYDDVQWYIIYDDTNSKQRSRFTIAHELGHIFLGHELKKGFYARTFDTSKPAAEQEADVFASRLLAPACVLWALKAYTTPEISSLCDISTAAAQVRSERMSVLVKRNKFFTSPLEREVYRNFETYIKKSLISTANTGEG